MKNHVLLFFLAGILPAGAAPPAPVFRQHGPLAAKTISLPQLNAGQPYSFAFSADTPASFGASGQLGVQLLQGTDVLLGKTLHAGDADLFSTFSLLSSAPVQVQLSTPAGKVSGKYQLRVDAWEPGANVEREPNNSWKQANTIRLGDTVFGSADDVPYVPLTPGRPAIEYAGADWFRFEFSGPVQKLVYFELDLMERDNIPVDVSVYRVVQGKALAFHNGEDPVTVPHEVQALPGNKFTTRILKDPGSYYIRVVANHPEYKLRSFVYDVPPYDNPRKAVRTAVDYVLAAGDSWHANTPRRGGVFDRIANVHQETSLCVACHATHFPQRAQLYATRNGYPVVFRQQLQFLTERFYNNPRPFYGFEKEGAVWARVISAPANVLGRMSHLMDVYEKEITGERRENFHAGVHEYLKLYYQDRTKLPADETNGNTPLVSTYEVAWYAWETTRDPQIAKLIEQDEIKNMVDLCYQTLALAAIDRQAHAAKIQRNAERILSLQRPSGQWAMRFEPEQPEAEFQTGHALWALHAAGIPATHPQVRKAIDYLMKRQQPFGGWFDPLQSYENFKTPFRETQMAVLALSAYFPNDGRQKGWNATRSDTGLLNRLDQTWGAQPTGVMKELREAAASGDVLVRQQAVEALGRVAQPASLPLLIAKLTDPSKLVQRTAAWAVRQVYSRHADVPAAELKTALAASSDRMRWGATRIFATHFAALAQRPEIAVWLSHLGEDSVTAVRMQAVKGLWQLWFWTPEDAVKDRIENTFLAAIAKPQHPWVQRNLQEGIYNLADENIRYLYNNWVPLLARSEDQNKVIQGRLRIEDRLARKFAAVLTDGPEAQKKTLLTSLTQLTLRRADVYDPAADLTTPPPPVYNRIGNDIEQIVFFGRSSTLFAKALAPLLNSQDPEMRQLAVNASLLTRDVKFPTVAKVSGQPGPERATFLTLVSSSGLAIPDVMKGLTGADSTRLAAAAPRPAPPKVAAAKLDEGFFNANVKPIFEAKGKDGYACVQCHATHTLFGANYASSKNVVDFAKPEDSLLLRKPTSTAESEGVVGAKTTAHGGGKRWDAGSPEYNTILNWIRGARN
ncbi:MAG TPA: HEAT repeat domain-containing protein [Bryobacteraceae bacterium]|nr:HEAT repeat domain-containing protein [Bryobacteraceae bacterium]